MAIVLERNLIGLRAADLSGFASFTSRHYLALASLPVIEIARSVLAQSPNLEYLVQGFPHFYCEQVRGKERHAEQPAQSVLVEP